MRRRLFDPARDGAALIVATHNPGKLREIAALIAPYGVEALSAGELGLPEPEETGESFVANARLKARAAADAAGKPALADDSGLAVEALGGAPGIYSARWAGPEKDFSVAMERVWNAVLDRAGEEPRPPSFYAAHFVCALCLSWPDGHDEAFEGFVHGRLVWPPRGERGFGYDPVFVPEGGEQTFAEMAPAAKHAMSHRADAFRQLAERCFGAGGGDAPG